MPVSRSANSRPIRTLPAEQALKDENCTVIEVDIPSFIAKFDGFAEANYPDLADWVARIKELDA